MTETSLPPTAHHGGRIGDRFKSDTTIQLHSDDITEVHLDPTDGVALVLLRMPGRANKINEAFGQGLLAALQAARTDERVKGLVIATGHKDFCVGADLDVLYTERDPARIYRDVRNLQLLYRELETCGLPVVAALTGSALGGGCELALACHHRVALDDARIQIGLPEVNLGLLPGAGGTQRLPRLIGLQAALEFIAQGRILRAPAAAKAGIVNELAADEAGVLTAARAWIAQHPHAQQPWDTANDGWPGGVVPGSEMARNLFMAASAMLFEKTAGAYPAAEAAVSAVQEGAGLSFDRALEVEARAFVKLAVSDQAKDMIRTFFFFRTAAEKHVGLPALPEGTESGIRKVGILGAGMMGAGLAAVCAMRGYDVVLKDIDQGALDRGMAHVKKEAERRARKVGPEAARAMLDRIHPTLDIADLQGTDLVIEAVVENKGVKHAVTREGEPLLSPNGIWASNTSALPITELAEASAHPDRFIGLHFFSPVEKMPLVEIIRGEATSEETVARCLDFCRRIKKTPILVNDGYGFYTSRTFAAYLMEAVEMVAEGIEPTLVEWAARKAGMVVPPLQVFDEVTLRLGRHVLDEAEARTARKLPAAKALLVKMVDELGRVGKVAGKGFYDYAGEAGGSRGPKRLGIWPGLRELCHTRPVPPGPVDEALIDRLGRRLLIAQCAEVARCIEDGVLRTWRDAEVGAIFGIGFAPNTGGPLAWMDRQGLSALVEEMDALAAKHGERFEPAPVLRKMAERGERFFPEGKVPDVN